MFYAIARQQKDLKANEANRYEYVMDKNNKPVTFPNKNGAIAYLLLKGIKANSEVELKEFFGIHIVEYKEK